MRFHGPSTNKLFPQTLTESAEIGKAQTKRFRQDSIKYTFTEVDLLLGAGKCPNAQFCPNRKFTIVA